VSRVPHSRALLTGVVLGFWCSFVQKKVHLYQMERSQMIGQDSLTSHEPERCTLFKGHGDSAYLSHWLPMGATLATPTVATYIK
jgi:hypothetical protein